VSEVLNLPTVFLPLKFAKRVSFTQTFLRALIILVNNKHSVSLYS